MENTGSKESAGRRGRIATVRQHAQSWQAEEQQGKQRQIGRWRGLDDVAFAACGLPNNGVGLERRGNSIEHSPATLFQGKADLTTIADSPSVKNGREQIDADRAVHQRDTMCGCVTTRKDESSRMGGNQRAVCDGTTNTVQFSACFCLSRARSRRGLLRENRGHGRQHSRGHTTSFLGETRCAVK